MVHIHHGNRGAHSPAEQEAGEVDHKRAACHGSCGGIQLFLQEDISRIRCDSKLDGQRGFFARNTKNRFGSGAWIRFALGSVFDSVADSPQKAGSALGKALNRAEGIFCGFLHTLDLLGPRFDECLSELLGSIKRIECRDRLDLAGANSKALRACDGFGAIGALKRVGEMQAVRMRGRSNGVKRAAQLCGGNEIGRRHRLKRLISCRLGFHVRQERGQAD